MANTHFQNMILWAGNNKTTKAKKGQPMFQPYPSDQTFYGYFNDFLEYHAGIWTITTTEAGTGSATEAITSGAGGQLLVTNAAGDNDADFFQLKGESFKFSRSKKAYFSARFKTSDATQTDLVFGIQITDTTPLTATDGIFFRKDDGNALLDLVVEKNNQAIEASGIATLANDTFITATWYIDPDSSKVFYCINNGDPIGVAIPDASFPDDEEITVSFGIQNGAAAAKALTVDYITAMIER